MTWTHKVKRQKEDRDFESSFIRIPTSHIKKKEKVNILLHSFYTHFDTIYTFYTLNYTFKNVKM